MRTLRFFLLCILATACFADKAPVPPKTASDMLPPAFTGWKMAKPAQISKSAGAADPTSPDVLREYGFTDFEGATYTRDDGRKLTIKAARFQDASGAYGALTFYRTPEMSSESIGDEGYSLNERILFYRGNVLVDAIFQQLSAMSAAELRELADGLPKPVGAGANLPGLREYLPKDSLQKNSLRYVVGPAALEKIGSPLPAQYVDFSKGAEVVLGSYAISGKQVRLILVGYPTPQIAASELAAIQAAQQSHQLDASQLATRRTGPILVMISGDISSGEAKTLLSSVNYDADVTWNQNTYSSRRDNPAHLIVEVIVLAGIVCGLSVVAGIAFGGFRLAVKRFFPNKVFDRPEQMEIIALHLSEGSQKRPDSP
jgi:hypothetical protein